MGNIPSCLITFAADQKLQKRFPVKELFTEMEFSEEKSHFKALKWH